jgi:hypothetical protein
VLLPLTPAAAVLRQQVSSSSSYLEKPKFCFYSALMPRVPLSALTTQTHYPVCGRWFACKKLFLSLAKRNCNSLNSYVMLKMPEAAAELIAGAAEAIECTRGFECERICF